MSNSKKRKITEVERLMLTKHKNINGKCLTKKKGIKPTAGNFQVNCSIVTHSLI